METDPSKFFIDPSRVVTMTISPYSFIFTYAIELSFLDTKSANLKVYSDVTDIQKLVVRSKKGGKNTVSVKDI